MCKLCYMLQDTLFLMLGDRIICHPTYISFLCHSTHFRAIFEMNEVSNPGLDLDASRDKNFRKHARMMSIFSIH